MGRFFLFCLITTLSFANPYKSISVDEKLTLFTNYFIHEALKSKFPKLPVKESLKGQDYNYEPTKYELYYNYVQRIKAIEESIEEEQQELDDKYEAEIYKYNKKIKALRKFYKKEQNLFPVINNSFNKAIKVVYGKPFLKRVDKKFVLDTQAIYIENQFVPKEISFDKTLHAELENIYHKCDLSVTFSFSKNILQYDEVICSYKDEIYLGKFNQNYNEKIKLNVKINDDIFQQIKMPNRDKN